MGDQTSGAGAVGDPGPGEQRTPDLRVLADPPGDVGRGDAAGVEAALLAGAVEDPGPVLGVGRDRHTSDGGSGASRASPDIRPACDRMRPCRAPARRGSATPPSTTSLPLPRSTTPRWSAGTPPSTPSRRPSTTGRPSSTGRCSSLRADGAVVGFAYATPYRPRAAYDRTREVSVYLAPAGRGRGTRPGALHRAAGPVASRRRPHRAGRGRDAEPGQRGAAPLVRIHPRRPAPRRGVEVRPLDRRRVLGAGARRRRGFRAIARFGRFGAETRAASHRGNSPRGA